MSTPILNPEPLKKKKLITKLVGSEESSQVVMAFVNWAIHVLQKKLQKEAKLKSRANLQKFLSSRIIFCNSNI